MLVMKSSLTNKVAVFKLVTGEEVIARIVADNSATGSVSFKNPLSMVMLPEETGQQGMVAFAPWILGAEDDTPLEIKMSSVIVMVEARADAAEQYSQAIGEEAVSQPKQTEVQNPVARRGGRR